MESKFEECSSRVSAGKIKHIPRDSLLRLYGLFSLVTKGLAPETGPSLLDFRGHSKWQSWKKVSSLSRHDAMQEYISLVESLESLPEEERREAGETHEGMGTDASIKGFTVDDGSSPAQIQQQRIDLTHWASVDDRRSIEFCLEKQNVSPDYRDEEGLTALMRAADRDARTAVRVLLRAGADVNAVDSEGQTALHYATLCDNPTIAGLLVLAGANPETPDNDDMTPNQHASGETRDIIKLATEGSWTDPEPLALPTTGSKNAPAESEVTLRLIAILGALFVCAAGVAYACLRPQISKEAAGFGYDL